MEHKRSKSLNHKLSSIIEKDFDGCEWFIIAANELMKVLKDTIEFVKDENRSFTEIKDYVGKIGLEIGNVERCLNEVEECYNKLIETLSYEAKKLKNSSRALQ